MANFFKRLSKAVPGLVQGAEQGVGIAQKQQGLDLQAQKEQNDLMNQLAEQAAREKSFNLGMQDKGFEIDPTTGMARPGALLASQRASALASEDPNSEYSKNMGAGRMKFYNTAAKGLGDALPTGLSATQQEAFDKSLGEKALAVKEAGMNRAALYATRQNDKETGQENKDFISLAKELNPNGGRAGNLGKLQASINQADRLKGLVANGTNLDSRQQEELAIGLQNLLSSGHSSASEVAALVPRTAMGSSQSLKEWLINSPQGLNNQAFVQRMLDTVDREKGIISGQLSLAKHSNAAAYSHLKEKNPAKYNTILKTHGVDPQEHEYFLQNGNLDGYGGSQQGAPGGLSQQEEQRYQELHKKYGSRP